MRILFDSKNCIFKDPFGTLTPGQNCRLNIHVPADVGAVQAHCHFLDPEGQQVLQVAMDAREKMGAYQVFSATFSLAQPGLYFYYFTITKPCGSFRLFKQGDDTNMEDGDLWQLSCIPADFTTPQWAQGAVIYQVFPDRFAKEGECDPAGKQQPYVIHENWEEEVIWQPDEKGRVLNNDFYGGNFRGITEKMDYIASLGATILYLNPISKSFSNHRYDTGDYKTPDPLLGTMADFSALCRAAHQRGIRVVLDGVYSHTGSDSLYFNRENTFPGVGAYQSKDSEFYSWYTFYQHPDSYNCWWDFDTLPTVNKMDPAFIQYIITDPDSVVAHWLQAGADGFRLDVADELPDAFIKLLKERIRSIKPDALLIGEVWEDASNKISYHIRRRYFVDGSLDSVMNYPFRTAILDFLWGRDSGAALKSTVMQILENYPPQVVRCNMNLLGTHDTPRILTALADDFRGDRAAMAQRRLSEEDLALARQRLMAASFLQYMLPGCPSLYYGDEAGMEGHKDPFNRRTYPWGREDRELLSHFKNLGQLRKVMPALRLGDLEFFRAEGSQIGFCRRLDGRCLRVYINCSQDVWEIPGGVLLYGRNTAQVAPTWLAVLPMGFCVTEDL